MATLREMGSRLVTSGYAKWIKYVVFVAITAFLIRQISDIGWRDVLNSLPTHPLFYILLVVLLFSLPISEVFIYRISWRFKGSSIFGMLIKKSVLNREVMGYSGEVLAYTWGKEHVDLPDREILKTIRDNNILSTVSSTVVAVGLIVFFLTFGKLNLADLIGDTDATYVIGALVAGSIIAGFAYRYRRFWFSMDRRSALLISSIYVGRQLLGMALQILQWAVALPEVDIQTWFTFGAVSMILSRVPVIPNKDLIFVSAGIGLAGVVDISSASVAGMLLVISALRRMIHFALFLGVSAWQKASTPNDIVVQMDESV